MNIIFAGTTDFAAVALEALLHFCQQSEGYELIGVYTQPDRVSGRGRHLKESSVKQCAQRHGLPLYQPPSLKTQEARQALEALQPDLMVVAAYGLLLPSGVLCIPPLGCINVHASLLPKWRGAAPIQRALIEGDEVTGITIMQMDAGLDTGDMLYQVQEPIRATDTAYQLEQRLATVGADALIKTIMTLADKQTFRQPQPIEFVSYASKLTKAEGMIDWSLPAFKLEREIRGFNPWPISFTWINNEKLRIFQAKIKSTQDLSDNTPGTIIKIDKEGILVSTGSGVLQLTHIQRENGRCLPVSDLINGALSYLKPDMRFESIK